MHDQAHLPAISEPWLCARNQVLIGRNATGSCRVHVLELKILSIVIVLPACCAAQVAFVQRSNIRGSRAKIEPYFDD
jgi:hypothetical protein